MDGLGDPGWTGVIIGLVAGIALTYISLRLSRERVRLMHRFVDTELVETKSDPTDPIEIVFEKQSVPRVNKSLLYLWNAGRKTAHGADIVKSDPLRVALPDDARMLRARMATVTRDVTQVKAEEWSQNEALVTFDFLDPGDGAVIEVMHTGDAKDRELKGTIKGLPEGPQGLSSETFAPRKFSWGGLFLIVFGGGLVLALAITDPTAPSGRDQRVSAIIENLDAADRETMTRYLRDLDALPEHESGVDFLIYILCLFPVIIGTTWLVSAGSRKRPPQALFPDDTRSRKQFPIRFRRRVADDDASKRQA